MSKRENEAKTVLHRIAGALLLGLLVSACGTAGPQLPPELAAAREKAAREPYPDLRDVPERPRLGYSIEQRRAIARELAADRANAAYEGQQLRYRTGLAATPPQPPPRPPQPASAKSGAKAPPGAPPPADVGRAYVEETLRGGGRTGELDDLIEWLQSFLDSGGGEPAAAAEMPAEQSVPDTRAEQVPAPEPEADPVASRTEPQERAAAAARMDVRATAEDRPGETAPALPLRLAFAPDSAELGAAERARLRALAPTLRESREAVIVEAGAPLPSLGQERLRAVARALVALGIPAGRIEMRQRGIADEARITLAGASVPGVAAEPGR